MGTFIQWKCLFFAMNSKENLLVTLSKYINPEAASIIAPWVIKYKVSLKISSPRKTKLGDYRAPFNEQGHRISINSDLNQHSFLITLIHEFAHLATFVHAGPRVKAHGGEWKNWFKKLMFPFLEQQMFPEDVTIALRVHFKNPPAASCTDERLQKVLHRYNDRQPTLVKDLPFNTPFILKSGKQMIKLKLLRKRFLCKDIHSSRMYTVSGLMEIVE